VANGDHELGVGIQGRVHERGFAGS
jgi:hypothetical protein